MGKEELNAKTPVAPIDMAKDLNCPLLGLSATTTAHRVPSR
jgi:carboxymethylenebutenolidase